MSRAAAAVPETLTIEQPKAKNHQGVSSLLSLVLAWRKGPAPPDLSLAMPGGGQDLFRPKAGKLWGRKKKERQKPIRKTSGTYF